MKTCLRISIYCFLLTTFCFLFPTFRAAQQTELLVAPESLRLPEIVITGIDRAKMQRVISKVAPPSSLPMITQSSRDRSETFVQEGDKLSSNRINQGETQYVKAIELDPTNTMAYLRLGDVYRALNKYEAAADMYHKALAVSADSLEAYYKLGMLYESSLQNLPQAIEYYRAYVQLGGTDRRVSIWLRDAERQQSPQ